MATVKRHLKSSSYKNKHTHCGVVPWWKQAEQIPIECWRERVYGGWVNWLMKTKLMKRSWLPRNDNRCQATETTVNNPFATSVDEQSFEPENASRALEPKATWVDDGWELQAQAIHPAVIVKISESPGPSLHAEESTGLLVDGCGFWHAGHSKSYCIRRQRAVFKRVS